MENLFLPTSAPEFYKEQVKLPLTNNLVVDNLVTGSRCVGVDVVETKVLHNPSNQHGRGGEDHAQPHACGDAHSVARALQPRVHNSVHQGQQYNDHQNVKYVQPGCHHLRRDLK